METPERGVAVPGEAPVSLVLILRTFIIVGLLSFGGGLSAWIRREVVVRRGWMDDRDFIAGYALSQIVPGANSPNIAVFIGVRLRGAAGGAVALGGLMFIPFCLILVAGALYLRAGGLGLQWVVVLFSGMGAAAIGMTISMGLELGRRNLSGFAEVGLVLAIMLAIDIFHVSLIKTMLAALPLGLLLTWQRANRQKPMPAETVPAETVPAETVPDA